MSRQELADARNQDVGGVLAGQRQDALASNHRVEITPAQEGVNSLFNELRLRRRKA